MKIAIIDDGINNGYFDVGKLLYDIEITTELQIIEHECSYSYYNNHSTTCAAIIKKYYEKAEFVSIKILDELLGTCTASQLNLAINWCVEKRIKLINLSLGTTDYRDFESIRKCINEAAKKGIVIIAAGSNKNIISYPAFLSNVIGVRKNEMLYGDYGYKIFSNCFDGIDCEAPGEHCLTNYLGEEEVTISTNSYSAPYITAITAIILESNKSLNVTEVKMLLQKKNINRNRNLCRHIEYRRIDWVEKALIFCFNKEIKYLINKQNIGFVADIIDIENRENCFKYVYSWLTSNSLLLSYDTIIIIDSKDSKFTFDDYSIFIEEINRIKVNFVYIDEWNSTNRRIILSHKLVGVKIWHQYLLNTYVKKSKTKLQAPVIKIIDNGLLHNLIALELREKFCSDGYYAISITCSSEGILFGSEYMFSEEKYNIKKFQENVYEIYNPDVIIYHYNSFKFECMDKNGESDIYIYIVYEETGDDSIGFFKCDKNIIYYTYNKKKTDEKVIKIDQIDNLYKYIYNILTV